MTPLHWIGESLREVLGRVPLGIVRLLFVGTLVALLIWVLFLPKERTTPPGGAKRWDENLKFGAAVALLIQIAIYSLL
ncbi:MAG: hypothetical protein ABGX22_20540 [Pirellulaceae bacterium]|nr:hypothetical protein [Planctomycetaceae bacterium]